MYKCLICEKEISNKGGFSAHTSRCKLNHETKEKIVADYRDNNFSIRDISEKYEISKNIINEYLSSVGIIRSYSESLKLVRIKKPECFKHTNEAKLKMRKARLKWMKDNPEKTAWRKSNLSYPEKVFKDKITELGLDKKHLIIRERSVFPYFIDFAFENEKVAVEIDGSQHELEERKNKDIEKDKLLISEGWRVYRVSAKSVLDNVDDVIDEVVEYLLSSETFKKSNYNGLYSSLELKEMKKEKLEKEKSLNNGYTNLRLQSFLNQRKVERPPLDILLKEVDILGYVGTGKKYSVSDNTIRKWIKFYKKGNKF